MTHVQWEGRVGLDDLKGLFQPKRFYHSVKSKGNQCHQHKCQSDSSVIRDFFICILKSLILNAYIFSSNPMKV